jgi:hypothetical protein
MTVNKSIFFGHNTEELLLCKPIQTQTAEFDGNVSLATFSTYSQTLYLKFETRETKKGDSKLELMSVPYFRESFLNLTDDGPLCVQVCIICTSFGGYFSTA